MDNYRNDGLGNRDFDNMDIRGRGNYSERMDFDVRGDFERRDFNNNYNGFDNRNNFDMSNNYNNRGFDAPGNNNGFMNNREPDRFNNGFDNRGGFNNDNDPFSARNRFDMNNQMFGSRGFESGNNYMDRNIFDSSDDTVDFRDNRQNINNNGNNNNANDDKNLQENNAENNVKEDNKQPAKGQGSDLIKKIKNNKVIVAFAAALLVLIILICAVSKNLTATGNGRIVIYYKGFEEPNIEYKLSEGKWTKEKLTTTDRDGYTHEFSVDLGKSKYMICTFNDGHGNIDNNGGNCYTFEAGEYSFNDGTVAKIGDSVSTPGGDLKLESFTVTPSEDVMAKDEVVIEAMAKGGSPKYSYAFGYFDEAGKEIILQNYGYESSVTWIPEKAGTYDLYVKVKDEKNNMKKKDIEGFHVGGLTITGIKTDAGDSDITTGTTVTLIAEFTGAEGINNIKCHYEISDGEKSEDINASTDGVAQWTPQYEGNYSVKCVLEDETKLLGDYTIQVEVKAQKDPWEQFINPGGNDNNGDSNDRVIIYYKGFNEAYIHYQLGNNNWTQDPGVKMERTDERKGYEYKAVIDLYGNKYIKACFND
ncbi:MAG: hypothetical protein K6G26_09545, partial [Lachnospiraceae bacterium]|nr:hypothetical protein [Lachnospiraceae bacterium]